MKNSLVLFLLSAVAFSAYAQSPNAKAWRLHNRVAGVPPTQQELNAMSQRIMSNPGRVGYERAAELAIEHDEFYNTTLKNLFKPLSNQARTSRVPLNDMTATLIGAVRDSDQRPFNRVLFDDVVYVGPSLGRTDGTVRQRVDDANNRRYQTRGRNGNTHYETIEDRKLNLKDVLVERRQSEAIRTETYTGSYTDNGRTRTVLAEPSRVMVNGVNGAAGVLTSRMYALEYFMAGTNRRVTRYTFMNFMCKDFEDLHDTSIPDFRVARDIDRLPGGDSRVYKNNCAGCHSGQDALRGALAYYDENGDGIQFTPGNVRPKMNRGAIYAEGHNTTDDSWINTWAQGKNAALGWRGATSGNGLREWGQMFARSHQFAYCMAQRVYKKFCYEAPDESDLAFIEQKAQEFETSDNYNFKRLVVKTVAKCIEDEYEN
jgi:hypothetical protein